MLDEKALKALDKLEILAGEKFKEVSKRDMPHGAFHDEDYRLLGTVPNWLQFIRENHENPFADSGVQGCLDNCRKVAKRFKFNLKE